MKFAGDNRWIGLETLRRAQPLLAAARRRADRDPRVLDRVLRLEKLVGHGTTHPIRRTL